MLSSWHFCHGRNVKPYDNCAYHNKVDVENLTTGGALKWAWCARVVANNHKWNWNLH